MNFWGEIWNRSFEDKKSRCLLHILFWVTYFFVFSFWDYSLLKLVGWTGRGLVISLLLSMVLNMIIIIGSYYITVATAYRLLFYKQKYLWFFIWLLVDIVIFSVLLSAGRSLPDIILPHLGITEIPKKNLSPSFNNNIFLAVMELVISFFALMMPPFLSKFFRDQLRWKERRKNLEKENLRLQMDFLKAQIHPHFLFNTLNNIYAMTSSRKSEKASEMISGLSSLLRYVLYEGKEEFIPLEKEVTLLKDFIALEAIRSDDLSLTVDFPESGLSAIKVPPFLLLPLIENAFKHGVYSQLDDSCIVISLQVNEEYIALTVENSSDEDYREKNKGGLGLINLEKRLAYYYNDTFDFQTQEKYNKFTAYLNLPTKCPKLNA